MATSDPSEISVVLSEDEESDSNREMPPSKKKKKVTACKFKSSWSLPPQITTSLKENTFAYCRLCYSHFSVSHGGLNNIKRHIMGSVHQQRLKDSSGSTFFATFFQKN